MGVASVSWRRERRAARGTRAHASSQRHTVTPAEAAWLVVVPCGLLTLAAILFVAPPLGHVLFPHRTYDFWPGLMSVVRPEPSEDTAFLLAIGGAVLLSAVVGASRLRPLALGPATRRWGVQGAQAAVCASLAVALIAQHVISFDRRYTFGPSVHYVYFTWPTVVVAALLTAAVAVALRVEPLRRRLAATFAETRARRIAALLGAAVFAALWLLTAIDVDSSVGNVNPAVLEMLPWSMDETWAILDGRTPLVDFHAQYAQLWPYAVAATMATFGASLGVYTAAMATIGGAALLALFATLRRVAHSSLAALALFLPLVATGFFMQRGPLANRYGASNLLTIFPVRYAGPYLLAWLLARHLDRQWPRRPWILALFAGFVVLNNPEFGLPALGATIVACIWARPPHSRRSAALLVAETTGGLLGALGALSLLTLLRTGHAPRFGLLFEFSRLYGVSGWASLPIPRLGFHLVVYATFVGALTLATVRAVTRHEDMVTTGLLAWSGVFGLGASAYFVGRSHPEVLVNLFSAWAFALALLVVVVVRTIAARPSGHAQPAELAVLFGMGLAVCSIAQTPTPWSQLDRIANNTSIPALRGNATTHFIADATRRGEHVAILNPTGHRIAYDLGLVNVSPYASSESIATRHQLADTVAALRAAHGTKVFLWRRDTGQSLLEALAAAGFRPQGYDEASDTEMLVDGR